ncbi:MAG: Gfo/Idh/MocA family oxidoreductase [Chloroflexi bacterium]|nr:Gfo/Idh/MocA family oxidoreductase [Chloroflexota bacterium]
MGKARIGIIGVGWWGTVGHLEPLLKDEKAEVVAISSRTEAKVKQRAEKYGIKRYFTDYREMIDTCGLDGVVVATTPNMHYEQSRYALEHNLNVLVEKPFMLKAEQAVELAALARERGKFITVCHPMIYSSLMARARQLICNELGRLLLVEAHFSQRTIDLYRSDIPGMFGQRGDDYPVPDSHSYADPEIAGGGEGHAQASHIIGSLLWLTGLEPETVFAFMDKQDTQVDVVDTMTVRFSSGVIGTITANGMTPPRTYRHTLHFQGENGYLFLDDASHTITIRTAQDNEVRMYRVDPTMPYRDMLPPNFVRALLGEEEMLVGTEIAVNEVRILDGAYRSAASGLAVKV